jgi:hypothetical protein
MYTLAIIGTVCLVLLAALLVFISMRPNSFRVERSAQVNAPADLVFGYINDLHKWNQWSPFEKLDPNMKKTYSGPEAGPGAAYAWSGNGKAGEGRLSIVANQVGEYVAMKLEFTRPFVAANDVRFTLTPSAGGTRVTWAMEGKCNFMAKAVHMCMNMDAMVGKEFAEGLANLDRLVQGE